MLTVRDDNENIFKAIQNGAQGYLLKTIRAKELVEMIRTAARGEAAFTPAMAARVMAEFRRTARLTGGSPASDKAEANEAFDELTTREQEVLDLIAQGLSDKEIAAALSISLYTVKSHVRNILAKLHVNNRREAARLAGGKL